jgi:putative hydrolase of HD superfamily
MNDTSYLRLGLPGGSVIVRDWKLDDIPLWERWLDPANDWYRTDGPYHPPPSPEEIAERIEALRARIIEVPPSTPRSNLVIADSATETLIGRVTRYWQDRATNWISVGIAIYDPAWRGRGAGLEALGLWTDHLFATLPDIVRLDLRTWSGNIGMIRLAEKLGYRLEARFRMARVVEGAHYDALGYGVLRSEWEAIHPHGFIIPARG